MMAKKSVQSIPQAIIFDCPIDKSYYSGLMCLLSNAELLAMNQNCSTLDPQAASYLQSAVERTASTLGNAFYALCALHDVNPDAREFIPASLLADFGVMMGELTPHFTQLAAELAEDATKQSPKN